MTLAHLTPLWEPLDLPAPGDAPERWVTRDLSLAARPVALAALAQRQRAPLLVVTARQETADSLTAALAQLLPTQAPPLVWSAADPLPYEQLPHDSALSARRSATLGRLRGWRHDDDEPLVIVATMRALMACVRAPRSFTRDTYLLAVGGRQDAGALVRQLARAGYRVEPAVDGPCAVSRRGGIVDVYTPGPDEAVRVEFFGDEIDSIRRFDPLTQRSIERCRDATILPPIEFDLSSTAEALRQLAALPIDTLRPEVQDEWRAMLARLEAGDVPAAIDLLATAFPGNTATLLDYLPPAALIARVEPQTLRLQAEQIALRAEEVRHTLEQAAEIPPGVGRPYAVWDDLAAGMAAFGCWDIGGEDEDDDDAQPRARSVATGAGFGEAPLFAGDIDVLTDMTRRSIAERWRVVFATDQSERLRDVLEDHDIYPRVTKRGAGTAAGPPPPGAVDVVHAALGAGFTLPTSRLVVLTDLETFGLRKTPRPATPGAKRRAPQRQFQPGKHVVHVEHGVGLFQGLVQLDLSGVEREYLRIDYAEGDRLYVPVDQSDRLLPYESPAGEPRVTRLSSPEWSRVKARVRQAVREMAFELLQVYAQREVAQGTPLPPDSAWDVELEESFPFRETPDQERAIHEVKADQELAKPMDRLVCGDVGYGKTEVALRAAFKAVNAGWQVAVLAPTTILALQHYTTFRDRLAPFPVTVEMLSRLRAKPRQAAIAAGVADGSIDIIIGTHRLLQRDVSFKRLGLLVVDEEQRFGVRHKEHIKRMRAEVDVLTMSATPIPRTLRLALTGIRDLSLITTPPQDRVPIRTFVTPYEETLVREAILREIARGGQVYVVHNRVQSIYRLAERLRELVPEASFEVAHGQMEEGELEPIVLRFVRHEFDALVCTTIIESGVDIPNVNTIVIDNAHQLGLTQLYQLRGRVGRGTQRAYAYLLYPPKAPLSAEALERLEAIQEATELGAGFQVALRDMEIRGAGNILGAQQSGHIAAVGFDLYARMLAHAVEEIKAGRPIAEPEDVTLDIAVEAGIPEDYIAAEQVRLEIYRQIASAPNGRALRDLDAELTDRFGAIPEPVERLFDLVRLRQRATGLNLTSIVERDGDIVIRPIIGARLSQERLRRALGAGVRVTPNQARLTVAGLRADVDRWRAITVVLDAIEEAGAAPGHQPEEFASSSPAQAAGSLSASSSSAARSARISSARAD